MTYHLVFGTNLAIESVFGNAVLGKNSFSRFKPIGKQLTAISNNLVSIGYDLETITDLGDAPSSHSFFTRNRQLEEDTHILVS